MLGLKLNHVSKRGHWFYMDPSCVVLSNTLGPEQDGWQFADNISHAFHRNKKLSILLKFQWILLIIALVRVMGYVSQKAQALNIHGT